MTEYSTRLYDSLKTKQNRKCYNLLLPLPPVFPCSRLISELKQKSKNNQEVFGTVLKQSNLLIVESFPFVSTLKFSYPVPNPALLLNAADTASQQYGT